MSEKYVLVLIGIVCAIEIYNIIVMMRRDSKANEEYMLLRHLAVVISIWIVRIEEGTIKVERAELERAVSLLEKLHIVAGLPHPFYGEEVVDE
jgi:hypothetical protein